VQCLPAADKQLLHHLHLLLFTASADARRQLATGHTAAPASKEITALVTRTAVEAAALKLLKQVRRLCSAASMLTRLMRPCHCAVPLKLVLLLLLLWRRRR
jgi:hypothetical protein